jgi:hypothetical protein
MYRNASSELSRIGLKIRHEGQDASLGLEFIHPSHRHIGLRVAKRHGL